MKNQCTYIVLFFQSFDFESFLEAARVTAAYCHNGACRSFIRMDLCGTQFSLSRCHKQFNEIILDPGDDHFGFRITESAIVFNHERFLAYFNKSEKNKSLVW